MIFPGERKTQLSYQTEESLGEIQTDECTKLPYTCRLPFTYKIQYSPTFSCQTFS